MGQRTFNHKKLIILTPLQEKIMILFCEDKPVKYIAKRLDTTIYCINSSLQQARKANNVKTNYGLLVRFIGNGYLDEYNV